MSFGASASTERALGSIGANTLAAAGTGMEYLGLRLSNQSGLTLDSFTLNYNGEQWRDGGAATPVAQSLTFMWSTSATAINDPDTSFTSEAGLNFTSPVFANLTSGGAVDGNVAGRVAIGPVTVTGISWLPGTDLWLRWTDLNDSGNDHGLAIDDLNFSALQAVPEPSTFVLLGIGSLAVLFRRRLVRK